MENYQTITIDIQDGVAELVLNRPALLNALDWQVADELCDALDRIRETGEARAVLLRGEGRAFCAGGNLREMKRSLDGNPAEFFDEPLRRIHDAALSLAQHRRHTGPRAGAVGARGVPLLQREDR